MSPRPRKPRRCSFRDGFPGDTVYKPRGRPVNSFEIVIIEHDEMEALHLCDGEGLTQDGAGESMGVSRGTVQRLLASARQKVASALTSGKALVIKSHMEDTSGEDG